MVSSPELQKFLDNIRGEMDRRIDSIPPAKSSKCSCGKQMTAANGMWWCEDCQVWKVKDAREMVACVQQPYIPLYVGEVHQDTDPGLTKRTHVLMGALKDGKAGLTGKNCVLLVRHITDASEAIEHLKWLARRTGFEVEKEGQHRAVINGINYVVMSWKKWERPESQRGWRPSIYYL